MRKTPCQGRKELKHFENGGGFLCSGGSASNQFVLITARNYLYPLQRRRAIPRGPTTWTPPMGRHL
ncbi:hypothetical protein BC936DRAFT_146955 [Jimgerdemannia flammicorona]|uniref:Uncharacterized protein n=1 Tax=Jimgerdemannia flammicorona TaxID=994334 RepID=A0A433D6G5_9FUNG|nr:hypothetical protein BC936DRAFT_146955 [Jimgerdemannia flammicorona]